MQVSSRALDSYFSSEVEHHSYFSIVPADSILRVGNVVDEVLYQLGQLIISLPAEAKLEILEGVLRQRIQEIRYLVDSGDPNM